MKNDMRQATISAPRDKIRSFSHFSVSFSAFPEKWVFIEMSLKAHKNIHEKHFSYAEKHFSNDENIFSYGLSSKTNMRIFDQYPAIWSENAFSS